MRKFPAISAGVHSMNILDAMERIAEENYKVAGEE